MNQGESGIAIGKSHVVGGWGGRGGTPYNSLYREALPKRGTFSRLQVYELGAVISLFEVYKKVRGNQLTDAFYGCEKVRHRSGFVIYSF